MHGNMSIVAFIHIVNSAVLFFVLFAASQLPESLFPPNEPIIKTFPWRCDFGQNVDSDLCDFTQRESSEVQFIATTEPTPTENSGPQTQIDGQPEILYYSRCHEFFYS